MLGGIIVVGAVMLMLAQFDCVQSRGCVMVYSNVGRIRDGRDRTYLMEAP